MKVQEVLENYNSLKASITIVEGEIQELENEILEEEYIWMKIKHLKSLII